MHSFRRHLDEAVHIDTPIERYPALEVYKSDILSAYSVLEKCFLSKGKLLIAGNGGLLRRRPYRRRTHEEVQDETVHRSHAIIEVKGLDPKRGERSSQTN